jgi:hypothetical protein
VRNDRRLVAEAAEADGVTVSPLLGRVLGEDDADAGHGWTCEPAPRSRRIDCMIMNVVL